VSLLLQMAPPRVIVVLASNFNLFAGVQMNLIMWCQSLYNYSKVISKEPDEIIWWATMLAGITYALGSVSNLAISLDVGSFASIMGFGIMAAGSVLFAVSADGNSNLIYSIKDMEVHMEKPETFPNTAAHLAFAALMIGTAVHVASVKHLPKVDLISPFYAAFWFFMGTWTIGVIVLWLPMLANSNSYLELVHLYGRTPGVKQGVHMTAPSMAWTWKWVFGVIGALEMVL